MQRKLNSKFLMTLLIVIFAAAITALAAISIREIKPASAAGTVVLNNADDFMFIKSSKDNTARFSGISDDGYAKLAKDGVVPAKNEDIEVDFEIVLPAQTSDGFNVTDSNGINNMYTLLSATVPATFTKTTINFSNCYKLENLYVDANNPKICAVNGVIYSKDMQMICRYPMGRAGGFIMPESVVTMEDDCFFH